jgi:hypothetical protein
VDFHFWILDFWLKVIIQNVSRLATLTSYCWLFFVLTQMLRRCPNFQFSLHASYLTYPR